MKKGFSKDEVDERKRKRNDGRLCNLVETQKQKKGMLETCA